MESSNLLGRYGWAAFTEVAQLLFLRGEELLPYSTNKPYWEHFRYELQQWTKRHAEPRRPRRDSRSTDVRPPSTIPAQRATPIIDAFSRLQDVATVRSFSVTLTAVGDYMVIVKVTLADRRPYYRYGRVAEFRQAYQLLEHFVSKQYWTPDRQETRVKR